MVPTHQSFCVIMEPSSATTNKRISMSYLEDDSAWVSLFFYGAAVDALFEVRLCISNSINLHLCRGGA